MNDNFDDIFGEIKPKSRFSSSTMTIIMGHPGVGKTTLATSAQELGKCILVNFENRIAHIDETSNLRFIPRSTGEFREDRICSYKEFASFLAFITSNRLKADYIIIDTIDSMFDTFLEYYIPLFKDARQAYGTVYKEIHSIFKKLKDSGCNVICTSHVLNDDILEKITVSLNEKLRNKMNALTDNIFFYDEVENGGRVLHLKTNNKVKCKLTTSTAINHDDVISKMENPTWKDIMEEISEKEDNIVEPTLTTMADDEVLKFKLSEHNINVKDFCKHFDIKKSNIAEKIVMLDAMVDEYVNEQQ